jgi:hypothetical protein
MFRAGFRVGEPAVLARAGETVVLFPFDEAAPAPPSPIWKCNVLEGFRFRVPEEVDVRFGKGSAVTFVGEVTHIRISTQGILQGTNWISVFRRQVSGP